MNVYVVEAMMANGHWMGSYGPFGTSDKAEDCALRLSERQDVMSAEIKEKKKKKKK